jgi:hypothetical protein
MGRRSFFTCGMPPLGTGTRVEIFQLDGTCPVDRDLLKIFVNIGASWCEQLFSYLEVIMHRAYIGGGE